MKMIGFGINNLKPIVLNIADHKNHYGDTFLFYRQDTNRHKCGGREGISFEEEKEAFVNGFFL